MKLYEGAGVSSRSTVTLCGWVGVLIVVAVVALFLAAAVPAQAAGPDCDRQHLVTPANKSLKVLLECGDPVDSFEIADLPEHGSIEGFSSASGELTYKPDEDFLGLDKFSFRGVNADGEGDAVEVTIFVRGTNGRIVFSSKEEGNWDIYSIRPDGSDRRRLTDDPNTDGDAVVTPDGKTIVFVSERMGRVQVFKMGIDGSNQVPITSGQPGKYWPAVSPDGKKVAYVRSDGGGWIQIYMVDIDGGDPVQLTFSGRHHLHPTFSPDGRYVYYVTFDRSVGFVDLESGQEFDELSPYVSTSTRLDERVDGKSFLSDGPTPDGYGLLTGDLVDRTAVYIEPGGTVSGRFSPDGQKIVFHKSFGGDPVGVFTINSDGSDERLVPGTGEDTGYPAWAPEIDSSPWKSKSTLKPPRKVRPGKLMKVRVAVRNDDSRVALDVRVCSKLGAKARKAFKIRGAKCRPVAELSEGESRNLVFRFKTTRKLTKACRRYVLRFSVSGHPEGAVDSQTATVRKKVRWPKNAARSTRPLECS